jgi:hypothetical protein
MSVVEEEPIMKRLKKVWLVVITVLFVVMGLYSSGWTGDTLSKDSPMTDEWNMIDLLVARPVGIAAWIIGTGVFVLSLPFTIPTGSTSDAAKMFVVDPFRFSFERKFPDDDVYMNDNM